MNNQLIDNIDNTNWLRTLDNYPRTLDDMKLLISIVDIIGIFNKYDIDKIVSMSKNRIDAIYGILRLSNYVVNTYIVDVINDVFLKHGVTYEDPDQLYNDINVFASKTINNTYPFLNVKKTKTCLIQNVKISADCDKDALVNEYINYTHSRLDTMYDTLDNNLRQIFDKRCARTTIKQIINKLNSYCDMNALLSTSSIELDIYNEEILCDMMNDIDYVKTIVNNAGYKILLSRDNSIQQLLMDHNFISAKYDLFEILKYAFENMSCVKLVENMTLTDYYNKYMKFDYDNDTFADFTNSILSNKISLFQIDDIIFSIVSHIFNIKIILEESDTNNIYDNTSVSYISYVDSTDKIKIPPRELRIFKYNDNYYNIYKGAYFKPINIVLLDKNNITKKNNFDFISLCKD